MIGWIKRLKAQFRERGEQHRVQQQRLQDVERLLREVNRRNPAIAGRDEMRTARRNVLEALERERQIADEFEVLGRES